jgi:hypothetical protein
MDIGEKIYWLWSTDSSATALVAANRFKPFAANLQNLSLPYVFHGLIDEIPRIRTTAALITLRRYRWQFNVVAASTSSARAILSKLITVMDGNHGGFNLHHQGDTFLEADNARGYVHYASEWLVTSNTE